MDACKLLELFCDGEVDGSAAAGAGMISEDASDTTRVSAKRHGEPVPEVSKRCKVAVSSVWWAEFLRQAFMQAGCSKRRKPLFLHSLCSGMGTDAMAVEDLAHLSCV